MILPNGSDIPASVWETPLGRWRLAWNAHLNGQPVEVPVPVVQPDPPRPDEPCPDEVEADAAVGVMPVELLVHAEPAEVA
jgi:hypothetical protein